MDQSLKSRLQLLCADISTPYAEVVSNYLKADDMVALASLEVKPQDYEDGSYADVKSYRLDSQLAALFRKNASLPTGIDTAGAALQKWYEAERLCCQTNARFSNYLSGYFPEEDWRIVAFATRVQRRVAQLLGRLPVSLSGKFGSGSTYEAPDMLPLSSGSLTAYDKQFAAAGTAGARELSGYMAVSDRFTDPVRFGNDTYLRETAEGNRWFCVPKNALTGRSIAIEPGLNVYLQLGVEEAFTAPLLRCGISIADGQRRHRELAKLALAKGLATLDETMASDLWSSKAVQFLLARAEGWFSLLCQLRSPKTWVEGKWVVLSKFSSMGNGYTFPLQTLLFYAITREICGEEAIVSVFGDDIICPRDKAVDVMAALRWFGHKPNLSKSYHEGGFRESCGEDFFYGVPCRPAYLEAWPVSPPEWISFANSLRRRVSDLAPFHKFWLWVKRQIPLSYRLGGPEYLGDAVIHGHTPKIRSKDGRYFVRGVRYVPNRLGTWHLDERAVVDCLLRGYSLEYENTKRGTRVLTTYRGHSGFVHKWFPFFG